PSAREAIPARRRDTPRARARAPDPPLQPPRGTGRADRANARGGEGRDNGTPARRARSHGRRRARRGYERSPSVRRIIEGGKPVGYALRKGPRSYLRPLVGGQSNRILRQDLLPAITPPDGLPEALLDEQEVAAALEFDEARHRDPSGR